MTREILVTGSNGQVGRALARLAAPDGCRFVFAERHDLDFSNHERMQSYLQGRNFSALVNCAAYTAVDLAETEVSKAWQVNAVGPSILAEYARDRQVPIIHISTDYVFSGNGTSEVAEGDPVGPLSVYGASKLGGEHAVALSGARHVVLRTSWVVSATGNNFVKTMLRLAETRESIDVVSDQVARPTSALDLARAIRHVLQSLLSGPTAPTGVFHFANSGETSWAGFAREIFSQSRARGGNFADVREIATAAYPTPARRPLYTALATSTFEAAFDYKPRPWQQALSEIMDELTGVSL